MECFEMITADRSVHRRFRARSMLHHFFVRAAGDTSGAAAIEFGIVVPLLALMVTAVIDLGFGIYYKMQVEDAAQVGAQWAMKNGFDATMISNAVTSATNASAISASPTPFQFCGCATGSSVSTATCGATCPGGAQAGTYATVSAQRTYYTILSYPIFPSSYNFTVQATARLQ
jgi:Flp pilus assembly protein TadG